MPYHGYHYVIELFRNDGAPLGRVPVTPDWEPAREWTHFLGVRRGDMAAVTAAAAHFVTPMWHPRLGEPYISGCRVVVAEHNGGRVADEISTAYFFSLAQRAAADFRENGALKSGEIFRYVVTAFLVHQADAQLEQPQDGGFAVQEVGQSLPLDTMPLAHLTERAHTCGQVTREDYPVFLAAPILDEAVALKKQAGTAETGGILIGRLHRDPSVPELFAEVTAQIPARYTQASAAHLTFTADTWTDVQTAITLRRRNEIMLGWWHTHPVRTWCKCPRERQQHCPLALEFFSEDDAAFHRTVFPRAYSVGLVLSDVPSETETWTTSWALFGWRHGVVQTRGFFVLDASRPTTVSAAAPTVEGV